MEWSCFQMRTKVDDNEIIGKRFKSSPSNDFTVIFISSEKSGRMKLFEVEFDEINGYKYKTLARKEDILKGRVKNPYYPSVYDVGYLGNSTVIGNKTQYDRWKNMISRCYNPKCEKYNTYGAVGVKVSDRWKCFEYYLEDFEKIDGYDKDNLSNLQIDKDTKVKGNKLYSLETCVFISVEENSKEMTLRNTQKDFIAISPTGEQFESNHQREFAKEHGLHFTLINDVLNGKQKTHRGWKFYYKGVDSDEY